ncbi:hypothetical protein Nepgr_004851 [Nepenthes gracilis]|uniref:Uncharacterized protein n=1 Tax=Nepenthes gracilis TaxID=150966 RepID=A0AAD3XFU5_NEPGR|nr:hypothetical protein Nepgr_004851 [Nepenthes gracilis]
MYQTSSLSPLLIRNLIGPICISAEKSILNLSHKSKPFQLLRWLLVSVALFVLRLITYLPTQFFSLSSDDLHSDPQKIAAASSESNLVTAGGDSAIARALSQVLLILNDIPVSSRKYEVVRSLAEKLIDDNLREGSEELREVNCSVLSAAFSRALIRLESALVDQERPNLNICSGGGRGLRLGAADYVVGWALKGLRSKVGRLSEEDVEEEARRRRNSAEKLAAELLWFGKKLAACGGAGLAVEKWSLASNLAWLALSAEPRLQCSLVKVSAFLIKQAKEMGKEEEAGESRKQTMLKRMLMSWLPLLCRACNGTDAPVLSSGERTEVERALEETIEMLRQQEDREVVLSLWLHHFTYCPSSDWPNLYACYLRWCTASRQQFLMQ